MAEYFSQSKFKRLPVAIQALAEKERAVFVMMRMKRDEHYIARKLDVSLTEARNLIFQVRDILVKEGIMDLVQDPVFYQLDHPINEENLSGMTMQISCSEMDPADRVELDRFYRVLENSISELPKDGPWRPPVPAPSTRYPPGYSPWHLPL